MYTRAENWVKIFSHLTDNQGCRNGVVGKHSGPFTRAEGIWEPQEVFPFPPDPLKSYVPRPCFFDKEAESGTDFLRCEQSSPNLSISI